MLFIEIPLTIFHTVCREAAGWIFRLSRVVQVRVDIPHVIGIVAPLSCYPRYLPHPRYNNLSPYR